MESFFLAETAKYLYLLFDAENWIHNEGLHGKVREVNGRICVLESGAYIFNTEAHPIDAGALPCCSGPTRSEILSGPPPAKAKSRPRRKRKIIHAPPPPLILVLQPVCLRETFQQFLQLKKPRRRWRPILVPETVSPPPSVDDARLITVAQAVPAAGGGLAEKILTMFTRRVNTFDAGAFEEKLGRHFRLRRNVTSRARMKCSAPKFIEPFMLWGATGR